MPLARRAVQVFLEQDYLRSDLAGNPPKLPTPKAGESPAEALRRVQWLTDETDLAVNRDPGCPVALRY
jgi:hypothetical protein